VHRLAVEAGRDAGSLGVPSGPAQHVGRDVDAIDVEARGRERNEQSTCATSEVQGRLAERLDRPPVPGELVGLGLVELRPVAGHQAVMPRPVVGWLVPWHGRIAHQRIMADLC
jgi:hypothetical protein